MARSLDGLKPQAFEIIKFLNAIRSASPPEINQAPPA
jgi:hypothetical protein